MFPEANSNLASQAGIFRNGRVRFSQPVLRGEALHVVIKDTDFHYLGSNPSSVTSSCAAFGNFPNQFGLQHPHL